LGHRVLHQTVNYPFAAFTLASCWRNSLKGAFSLAAHLQRQLYDFFSAFVQSWWNRLILIMTFAKIGELSRTAGGQKVSAASINT
jgi:hypothetical protein